MILMIHFYTEVALLSEGWATNVRLSVDEAGKIALIDRDAAPLPGDQNLKDRILVPAPANLHSHAFQRAMAGLTETRGSSGQDSFWTWRRLMYSFLDHLTPNHIEAINAFAQMEMLEAGYASVAEFHYVHHQLDGTPYDNAGETSARAAAAAKLSGIGLTLLPVYYAQGGVDGRPLQGGQLRFKCDFDLFSDVWQSGRTAVDALPDDCRMGIAPHSLRATSKADLESLTTTYVDGPIHIHIAEQLAEIEEIEAAYGQRPVEWLLNNVDVGENWCLVHATHLTDSEISRLASSKAVAGLCPITEANLGDGIFDAASFMAQRGRIGFGTDSNISISLIHELRALEYSQRLNLKSRSVLSSPEQSTGRTLFTAACVGGAQAAGRASGALEVGMWADMMTLDTASIDLAGLSNDTILDTWVFASNEQLITDLWSAGRHVVRKGRHINRGEIEDNYRQTIHTLRGLL